MLFRYRLSLHSYYLNKIFQMNVCNLVRSSVGRHLQYSSFNLSFQESPKAIAYTIYDTREHNENCNCSCFCLRVVDSMSFICFSAKPTFMLFGKCFSVHLKPLNNTSFLFYFSFQKILLVFLLLLHRNECEMSNTSTQHNLLQSIVAYISN